MVNKTKFLGWQPCLTAAAGYTMPPPSPQGFPTYPQTQIPLNTLHTMLPPQFSPSFIPTGSSSLPSPLRSRCWEGEHAHLSLLLLLSPDDPYPTQPVCSGQQQLWIFLCPLIIGESAAVAGGIGIWRGVEGAWGWRGRGRFLPTFET